MKLKASYEFSFSPEEVFFTFRDRGDELSNKLPNVTKVTTLEKKKISKTKMKTRGYTVAMGHIPPVLRRLVHPYMLTWEDEAMWDEEELTCTWITKPKFFKEVFHCTGVWKASGVDKKAKMELDADLKINIPILGRIAEKFISKNFYVNLDVYMNLFEKLLKKKQ